MRVSRPGASVIPDTAITSLPDDLRDAGGLIHGIDIRMK